MPARVGARPPSHAPPAGLKIGLVRLRDSTSPLPIVDVPCNLAHMSNAWGLNRQCHAKGRNRVIAETRGIAGCHPGPYHVVVQSAILFGITSAFFRAKPTDGQAQPLEHRHDAASHSVSPLFVHFPCLQRSFLSISGKRAQHKGSRMLTVMVASCRRLRMAAPEGWS